MKEFLELAQEQNPYYLVFLIFVILCCCYSSLISSSSVILEKETKQIHFLESYSKECYIQRKKKESHKLLTFSGGFDPCT